ncbi:MarR family winged helix-turn-helix transcriptional regulator [Demequina soli]|uniref:MarR family winged helix-turn-helix transcriptional regulator n=1 Tax=Demequina soli TaxID=1638987 RepID=UPI00078285A1|nr:MarR family transcriptional regulator [Demequina soli]
MPPSLDMSLALQDALRPVMHRLDRDRTLSLGKLGLLARLSRGGAASASELAHALRISPQAVTIAVRELEDGGLVARTPDPEDRRRSWIDLTEAGRERYEVERRAGAPWLAQAIEERLDDAGRASLAAAIPVLAALAEGAFDA